MPASAAGARLGRLARLQRNQRVAALDQLSIFDVNRPDHALARGAHARNATGRRKITGNRFDQRICPAVDPDGDTSKHHDEDDKHQGCQPGRMREKAARCQNFPALLGDFAPEQGSCFSRRRLIRACHMC